MIESAGLVDIHNHIIPGVDDGARDLEESLAAVGAMYEQGVRRMVATPHIDANLLQREQALAERLERVDAAWEILSAAAAEQFPDVDLRRGHEIMLDLPQVHPTDPRCRLAGGPAVLVEFPRLFVPAGAADVLYHLRISGYYPIVAHPERSANLDSGNLASIEEWRRVGALMLVNAGSLLGGFGPAAEKAAREMLRRGWVDGIGSDYHARSGRRPLVLRRAFETMTEWGGADYARLLFAENPARLMDGQEPLEVPPIAVPTRFWRSIRRIFAR